MTTRLRAHGDADCLKQSFATVLFVTADIAQTAAIRADLATMCSIAVLDVNGWTPLRVLPSLIISDLPLDDACSVEKLRRVIGNYAKSRVPLLCLGRKCSRRECAQAYALGAVSVLAQAADRDTLLLEISRLLGATARKELDRTRQGIEDVGAAISAMFHAARVGVEISPAKVEAGADSMIALVHQVPIYDWLLTVRSYDATTYQHCLLVTGLACTFGLRLGFSRDDQRLLAQAALVHDVGKSRVSLSILNKPGPLSPDEMAEMRTHAKVGYELLSQQRVFDARVLDVVRHHHEYLDGSGYPDGLEARDITDLVRLTTICDIYAALIERRPYKSPMSADKAVSILRQMIGKLDPHLTEAFIMQMPLGHL